MSVLCGTFTYAFMVSLYYQQTLIMVNIMKMKNYFYK